MINLWDYKEAKTIKLIDIDGNEFFGSVDEITDSGEYADETILEDGITLYIEGKLIEFMQSEIKSIEIVE